LALADLSAPVDERADRALGLLESGRVMRHKIAVLRWHRNLTPPVQAERPGRPPTVRSIRALVLRMVHAHLAGFRLPGTLNSSGLRIDLADLNLLLSVAPQARRPPTRRWLAAIGG
jgi:hypothetical protein